MIPGQFIEMFNCETGKWVRAQYVGDHITAANMGIKCDPGCVIVSDFTNADKLHQMITAFVRPATAKRATKKKKP